MSIIFIREKMEQDQVFIRMSPSETLLNRLQ
jgi:hypothetical protein